MPAVPIVLWVFGGGALLGGTVGFAASDGFGKVATAVKWGAGAVGVYYAFQAAKGAGLVK